MLRLTSYTISNRDRVRLGGWLSNIGLTLRVLRLSSYTIFNDDMVMLGGPLSYIRLTIAMPRRSG